MTVDGVEWTLRFDEDGNHHWEAPGVSSEEKDAASIDLGQLAQAPSPCLDPEETSLADQVPQSVRISIRQQVVTEAPDPDLVDALAKKNVKMHTKEEEDPREGSKVFHPAAAKALKLKQAVMLDPIEPPKVDEAKIDAMVDLTSWGRCSQGHLALQTKKLVEPNCSDSWTLPSSETAVRAPTLPMHRQRWRRHAVRTWPARQQG